MHRTGIKVMSYNIKHGHGNDGVIDLERAAAVIEVGLARCRHAAGGRRGLRPVGAASTRRSWLG